MVTESAIENSVVSESFIEEMAFKQTLECHDGLGHSDFGSKNKRDPENSKCNIRRCLQQGQGWLYKDGICIAKIYLFPTRSERDQTGGVVNAESMIYLAFSNDR